MVSVATFISPKLYCISIYGSSGCTQRCSFIHRTCIRTVQPKFEGGYFRGLGERGSLGNKGGDGLIRPALDPSRNGKCSPTIEGIFGLSSGYFHMPIG